MGTGRVKEIITEMKGAIPPKEKKCALLPTKESIRYSPINEGYRKLVNFSLSILNNKPMESSSKNEDNAFGVLIDMAEVWELYLFQLIRNNYSQIIWDYTAREDDVREHLMHAKNGKANARLKPDIIGYKRNSLLEIGIIDAKYKKTEKTTNRPNGILREDLYQMTAYLSSFGQLEQQLQGVLIYPLNKGTTSEITNIENDNPWKIKNLINRNFYFLGLEINPHLEDNQEIIEEELRFLTKLKEIFSVYY